MNKAGGIIGVIAGVFGVVAAVFTLLAGGIGSVFDAAEAETVVGLGWGGILFSFLVIVFGVLAIVRWRWAGMALIICSILGVVLGGTMVAICMALSLIGGILAAIGTRKERSGEDPKARRREKLVWAGAGIAVCLVLAGMAVMSGKDKTEPRTNPLDDLVAMQPSGLKAEGELSELFALGSKYTDLQRENKSKEIIGQVVEWRLPVYEVSKSGDGYRVQTQTRIGTGMFGTDLVGTFVHITPRSDEDRRIIEALKTDDMISFKGQIADTSLRTLTIRPAILVGNPQQAETGAPAAALPPPADGRNNAPVALSTDLSTLRENYSAADQEINAVYRDTMSRLSTTEKAQLKAEQIAWIERKKSDCETERDEVKRLHCLTVMTWERIDELKEYGGDGG